MKDPGNKVIVININIDGIPVFPTNTVEMGPILCRVVSAIDSEPFVVSISAGKGKSKSLEEFFGPFLEEMIQLEKEGLELDGQRYTIKIRAIIFDAPARQFVQAIKGHNGYGGCERCTQKGTHIKAHKCMVFANLYDFALRTENSFRNKTYKNHHVGTSPLLPLHLGMISSFPLDYMHLVLLCVFKRLILVWTGQWHKKKLRHKIGMREKACIDRRLRCIGKSYPKLFYRITRSRAY
jgi:hypothetical protein